VRVIKHGNRSASSRCGSADVLEAAGLPLELSAPASRRLLDELGICFLFAPAYHPALRQVAPVRKALGVRTLFNFLGPVCNPGGVRHQVLGVPLQDKLEPMAQALEELGHRRALVVHGAGGADELTLAGANQARPVGTLRPFDYDAPTLGLEPAPNSALAGGGPEENLRILRQVFSGEPSPAADAVALNAAAALVVSGVTPSPGEGRPARARRSSTG
jgi:anthranilate phosphoribosyltransferase